MRTTSSAVPVLAVVMVVVLLVTLAAPARAEADALLILGIVGLAVAGAIIIVYLIAAAGSDPRGSEAYLDESPTGFVARVAQTP